jgi:hypothetical protein
MALVTCPDCGREVSDAAPACPQCGRPTAVAMAAPAAAPSKTWSPITVFGGGFVVLCGVAVLGLRAALPKPAETPPPEAPAVRPAAAMPAETPHAAASFDVTEYQTIPDVFAALRPQMGDTVDEDSVGARRFALWAAHWMIWNDVHVDQDETTFAAVQKNSGEQIGQRMCSSGEIVEIHSTTLRSGEHLAVGLLLSDAGHLYRFMVGGSSGSLGEQARATLCGFVTGNYDYSNSAGGTGHAVAIVGMLDLPANRKPGR